MAMVRKAGLEDMGIMEPMGIIIQTVRMKALLRILPNKTQKKKVMVD